MHESSLLTNLMKQIEAISRENGGKRVAVVRLKLGPLMPIDPEHLREHFRDASRGTVAEQARLEIESSEDWHELTLESLDLESASER
jgi:hydrogenase nickel incorporation protein HypA/HybF